MSNPNNPAKPAERRKLSAFASAQMSFNICAEIGAEDVQSLRPHWSEAQCQEFLREHGNVIGREMVMAGANKLAAILKGGGNAD